MAGARNENTTKKQCKRVRKCSAIDCRDEDSRSCHETPPDAWWSVSHFIWPSQVHMRAEHIVLVFGISSCIGMHEILLPNLLANLSRTKRSQRPAQIPATGHAMKKRRTPQRTAKMGLPDDMVITSI